jgi:hypothetical protein
MPANSRCHPAGLVLIIRPTVSDHQETPRLLAIHSIHKFIFLNFGLSTALSIPANKAPFATLLQRGSTRENVSSDSALIKVLAYVQIASTKLENPKLNFKAAFTEAITSFIISVNDDFLELTRLKVSLTRFVDDMDQSDLRDGPPSDITSSIALTGPKIITGKWWKPR